MVVDSHLNTAPFRAATLPGDLLALASLEGWSEMCSFQNMLDPFAWCSVIKAEVAILPARG
jgi:hypothetical protein